MATHSARSTASSAFNTRASVSSHLEFFYNWFASIGISCVYISRTTRGELIKKHITTWRLILFILLRCNLAAKTGFLLYLLLAPENSDSLDFLTVLGISIWIVLAGVAVYSDYYFAQIFPTFEVFCAFWNVQSDIYAILPEKSREEYKKALNHSSKIRTVFHTCASLNAMTGLAVQYIMDPKGFTFTGSLIESDSIIISLLFALHEQVFMVSVWYQAVSIILIPVLVSNELKVTLQYLEKELIRLQLHMENNAAAVLTVKSHSNADDDDGHNNKGALTFESIRGDNIKKLNDDGDNSSYNIDRILEDYQHLEIIADRLKHISCFLLLITQIIYFAQITSDVFVGIQLMRVGDTLSVAFYACDCTAGMGYWFFSLYSMGRLDEAMKDFHFAVMSYFRLDSGKRKVGLRVYKGFREISVYLGPSPVRKGTAAEVIFQLFNYYILAAMW